MRIRIDALNSTLLASLAAPPVRVADEEELLVAEVVEAGEIEVLRVGRGRGGEQGGEQGGRRGDGKAGR